MKIAVLTYNFNNNYGGMLQAYAMLESLKRLDHGPELLLVSTISMSKTDRFKFRLKKYFFCYISNKWNDIKHKNIIEKNTNYFINKYITPKTKPMYKEAHFNNVIANNYDAYLVGSDQVWRAGVYRYIDYAFFGFVKSEAPILLSYAASFGIDTWEFTPEQTSKYKEQLKRFKGVAVREDSAVELCKNNFDNDAIHVLDPTMLLNAADYRKLAQQEREPAHDGDLLTYVLDENEDKQIIINSVAQALDLKAFKVNLLIEKQVKAAKVMTYPTVTSWLKGYDNAQYVITDSFHGCVFAILFNKPFIAIGNKARGMARFTSLLKMFDLENRLVLGSDAATIERIKEGIDWTRVNKRLAELRAKSLTYLIDTLKTDNTHK